MEYFLPSLLFVLGVVACGTCTLYVSRQHTKNFNDYKDTIDRFIADANKQLTHYEKEIELLTSNIIRMQSISPKAFDEYVSSIRALLEEQINDLENERSAIISAITVCNGEALNCLSEEQANLGVRIDSIKSVAAHLNEHTYLSALVYTATLGMTEQFYNYIKKTITDFTSGVRPGFKPNTERNHES